MPCGNNHNDPEKVCAEFSDMLLFDYEDVSDHDTAKTRNVVRVPGGWVYEVETAHGISTCFIPLPEGRSV